MHTLRTVTEVLLPGLKHLRSGKVREIYEVHDYLLLVATDRISAFDVVLPNGIPDKGKILTQLSVFWFEKLSSIVQSHLVAHKDEDIRTILGRAYSEDLNGRCMLVKKCEPIKLEFVARKYIAGSLYKDYIAAGGLDHDVRLYGNTYKKGLLLCSELPEVVFTPATKSDNGHDENIDISDAKALIGEDLLEHGRLITLRLFEAARQICSNAGIILADTKFEFGIHSGEFFWIDEALTPDSSRFWQPEKYRPGVLQESLDKQFVRDYLETLGWNKTYPGPELPNQIIMETRNRYIEIFQRITGVEPKI